MAADDEDDDEEGGGGSSKKKKLIIIIAGVLLLIILGVGGYFGFAYFTQTGPFEIKGPTPEEIAAARAAREEQERLEREDRFITFSTSFTFNVSESGKSSKHIVQIEMVLLVQGPENEELANKHIALLQSHISDILSEQTYEGLVARGGKIRLKEHLLESIRSQMVALESRPIVEQVLFTNFVMQ